MHTSNQIILTSFIFCLLFTIKSHNALLSTFQFVSCTLFSIKLSSIAQSTLLFCHEIMIIVLLLLNKEQEVLLFLTYTRKEQFCMHPHLHLLFQQHATTSVKSLRVWMNCLKLANDILKINYALFYIRLYLNPFVKQVKLNITRRKLLRVITWLHNFLCCSPL